MMVQMKFVVRIFVFLLAGLLAGCQAATPAPAVVTQPVAAAESAAQMDAKIAEALKTSFSQAHRVESVTVTQKEPNKPSKTVLEFVPPNRLHIIGDPELLVVDQKVYMKKASDSKWSLTDQEAKTYDYGANFSDFKDIQEVKALGTESLNGTATQMYGFTSSMTGQPGPVKIWIGADGRVYKLYYEGLVAYVTDMNEMSQVPASITMTFQYNPAIQITPPPQ